MLELLKEKATAAVNYIRAKFHFTARYLTVKSIETFNISPEKAFKTEAICYGFTAGLFAIVPLVIFAGIVAGPAAACEALIGGLIGLVIGTIINIIVLN